MLDGDWDTMRRRWPRTRSRRAPTSSTCASTTSAATAPPTWTRSPVALRHPGQRAARARLHRAAGHRGRPPVARRPGHPQLGQPRGRRRARAPASTGSSRLAREYGAAVDLPAHRRGGPGPRRRVEAAGRPPHPRPRRRPLRPRARRPHLRRADLPALHRRRRPARRRHGHHRGHPAHQGRAARRAHHARALQRVLRPQAGGPPRPQLGVPARVRAGRARLGHRARGAIMPLNRIPDEQREVCLDLIYDRRPPAASGDEPTYDPLQTLLDVFADVNAGEVESRRTAPAGRSSSACRQRIIDGDRDGLDGRPRRGAWPTGITPLAIINDVLLGRHEGRRRPVRHGRDAAAVRAAVGRDDEDVGRLPRAPHGEGRRRAARAASCWPPSRATSTTSARTSSTSSSPTTATRCTTSASRSSIAEMIEKAAEVQGRRHRHERPAGEEHADHAREPRGAERPRPGRASRCCSAAPRSPAPTSSATCARSTRAGCSTARTPSRACT